jgi:hypothetical protein
MCRWGVQADADLFRSAILVGYLKLLYLEEENLYDCNKLVVSVMKIFMKMHKQPSRGNCKV